MAVTEQNGTEYGNTVASPPVLNETATEHGRVRLGQFTHAQDGAGSDTSTVNIFRLPPGRVRVLLALSYVEFSALGASTTMDLGHAAYTDLSGTAVAADADDLSADIDVSSAGSGYFAASSQLTAGLGDSKLFDSRDGVLLFLTINDAGIPDAATVAGQIVYVVD